MAASIVVAQVPENAFNHDDSTPVVMEEFLLPVIVKKPFFVPCFEDDDETGRCRVDVVWDRSDLPEGFSDEHNRSVSCSSATGDSPRSDSASEEGKFAVRGSNDHHDGVNSSDWTTPGSHANKQDEEGQEEEEEELLVPIYIDRHALRRKDLELLHSRMNNMIQNNSNSSSVDSTGPDREVTVHLPDELNTHRLPYEHCSIVKSDDGDDVGLLPEQNADNKSVAASVTKEHGRPTVSELNKPINHCRPTASDPPSAQEDIIEYNPIAAREPQGSHDSPVVRGVEATSKREEAPKKSKAKRKFRFFSFFRRSKKKRRSDAGLSQGEVDPTCGIASPAEDVERASTLPRDAKSQGQRSSGDSDLTRVHGDRSHKDAKARFSFGSRNRNKHDIDGDKIAPESPTKASSTNHRVIELMTSAKANAGGSNQELRVTSPTATLEPQATPLTTAKELEATPLRAAKEPQATPLTSATEVQGLPFILTVTTKKIPPDNSSVTPVKPIADSVTSSQSHGLRSESHDLAVTDVLQDRAAPRGVGEGRYEADSEARLWSLQQAEAVVGRLDGDVNATKYSAGVEMTLEDRTEQAKNSIVVVAIQLGATYSGYSYRYDCGHSVKNLTTADVHVMGRRGDESREVNNTHALGRWGERDPGVIDFKTPSKVLIGPGGVVHSLGFAARNEYWEVLSCDERADWFYLDSFKGLLDSDVSSEPMMVAENGSKMAASDVIKMVLQFFMSRTLDELRDHWGRDGNREEHGSWVGMGRERQEGEGGGRFVEDVCWVLSLPNSLSPAMTDCIKTAAIQCQTALFSGGTSGQVLIVGEAEAAARCVRGLGLDQLVTEPTEPLAVVKHQSMKLTHDHELPVHEEIVSARYRMVTRYAVLDCGGHVTQVTVHDVNIVTDSLQQVFSSSSKQNGSTVIDAGFVKLLGSIFGSELVDSFKRDCPIGWIGLMISFETCKRVARPSSNRRPLNVTLPFAFIETFEKTKGISVEQAVLDYRGDGPEQVRWTPGEGLMWLSTETMMNLFKPAIDVVKQIVRDALNNVQGVEDIYLSGGFCESSIVHDSLRKEFSERVKLIIPRDASLAVLKGAVLLGRDQAGVSERPGRDRKGYGVAVMKPFIDGKHQDSKLVRRDGQVWCKDVLDKLTPSGQLTLQEVKQRHSLRETVMRYYTPSSPSQTHINLSLYTFDESNEPDYVTDEGVINCALVTLHLPIPPGRSEEEKKEVGGYWSTNTVRTYIRFERRELSEVLAFDDVTGERIQSTIRTFH